MTPPTPSERGTTDKNKQQNMAKQYLFNENGVCTNPDILGKVDWNNMIEVARAPDGKWGYGFWYKFDQNDGSSGCCGVWVERCIYESRREAVIAACQYIREIADEQDSTGFYTYFIDYEHRKPCTCHNMRECIAIAYNEVSQQKLFEL